MSESEQMQENPSNMCTHGNFLESCPVCATSSTHEWGAEIDVVAAIQEIQTAEPDVKWTTHIPDTQYGVVINLPYDCFISATLQYDAQGKGYLYIDMFGVNPKLKSTGKGEGAGIGTRLLKLLIAEGKKYGAESLGGHIISKAALAVRAKVCGEKNLSYYSHETGAQENKTLEDIFAEEHELGSDIINYNVIADIRNYAEDSPSHQAKNSLEQ